MLTSNQNPDNEPNCPTTVSFVERVQTVERQLLQSGACSSDSLAAPLIRAQELLLEGSSKGDSLSADERLALDRLEHMANGIVLENDNDLSVLSDYLAENPIPEPLLLLPFSDCLTSSDYELLAELNPEKQRQIRAQTVLSTRIAALNEFGEAAVNVQTFNVQALNVQKQGNSSEANQDSLSIKRLEDSPEQLAILFSGSLASAICQVRLGTVFARKSPTEQGLWLVDFSAFLPAVRLIMQQHPISVSLQGTEPLERLIVLPTLLPTLLEKNQRLIGATLEPETRDAISGRNQYSWLSALRYPETFLKDCSPVSFSGQNACASEASVQAFPTWILEPKEQKERILQIQFVGLERLTTPKIFCRFFGRTQTITADHPILCLSETQFEAISDYQQAAFQIGLQPEGPFVRWNLVETTEESVKSVKTAKTADRRRNQTTGETLSESQKKASEAGFSLNVWREEATNNGATEAPRNLKSQNQDDWFFQPTEEQQETLDCMGAIPRLLVKGSAGTGKTMLGFYQAQKFALSGKSTLFMCFNRNLAQWLARRIPDELKERLTVRNYHALCYDYATRAGLDFNPAESGSGEDFWQNKAPKLLQASLDRPDSPRFDAIIMDEAQDFRSNWLESLEGLLTSSRAPLYLFCDPRQNLFQNQNQDQTLDMLRNWLFARRTVKLECSLVQNCRNVRNIARYSGQIIGQNLESMAGMKDGPEVYVYQTADAAENRFMANWIVQNQLDRSVRPGQMAILSHRTRKNSPLGSIEQIAGVPITEDLELWQNNGGILYSSIRRFKGLEADNILLLDVGPYESRTDHGFSREELYTGCTRARQSLSVLTRPNADSSCFLANNPI